MSILDTLSAAGLTVALNARRNGLLVRPRDLLTPEATALIRRHRNSLLEALLSADLDAVWPPVDPTTSAALCRALTSADKLVTQ